MYYAPITFSRYFDKQKINISPDLTIRRITKDELKVFFLVKLSRYKNKEFIKYLSALEHREVIAKNKIFLGSGWQGVNIWDDIPGSVISIEKDLIQHPRHIIVSKSPELIIDLVLALRLLKSGHFLCPKALSINRVDLVYPFNFVQEPPDYELVDNSEIKNLKQIFKSLGEIGKDDKWEFIKLRLDNVFNLEIDNRLRFLEVISLIESVILGKNDSNEITFKFTIFLASLLTDLDKKVNIDEIKDLYKMRSKVIHTGSADKGIDLDYSLEKSINLLRPVINDYLNTDRDGRKDYSKKLRESLYLKITS